MERFSSEADAEEALAVPVAEGSRNNVDPDAERLIEPNMRKGSGHDVAANNRAARPVISSPSRRIKAVGLLSGGLDSTLAARLMMEQGIEVHAINFVSPFCTCTAKSAGCPAVVSAVRQLGDVPLKRVILRQEYLDMVREPRFGYGRAMNPCIDCRIMKIRKAGEYMREIGADFLFTGEVLGQRPMSQHRKALETIDRAGGLEGLILRPLSCGLLPPTIPEQRGWIDREQLCSIAGRSRKPQIGMARDFAINDYPCPAGGCLLTEPGFAAKLKTLMSVRAVFDARDVRLLKIGRFEVVQPDNLLFIARNEQEGRALENAAADGEHLLIPRFSGPTVLLRGQSIDAALSAIVRYAKPEKYRRRMSITRMRVRHGGCGWGGNTCFMIRNASFVNPLIHGRGPPAGRRTGARAPRIFAGASRDCRRRVSAPNLAAFYRAAAECFDALPAFATRKQAGRWEPLSFRELYEQGCNLAAGLIDMGVRPREHVGLFGENRAEWVLADCAVQLCGAADVPRGVDVTDDELGYIVNHAGIRIAFVESRGLLERLLGQRHRLPGLREIVILDRDGPPAPDGGSLRAIRDRGARLRAGGDRRVEERIAGIRAEDLFTLIYTSGTTGKPKGVMLTHANIMSQIERLPGEHDCTDRALTVLPIWHIFERVVEMYAVSAGVCTYYSSPRRLRGDLSEVEPTVMASTPRLWENLRERISDSVRRSHPVRRALFRIALFFARHFKEATLFLTGRQPAARPRRKWKQAAMVPLQALRWMIALPWHGFFNAAVLERIRAATGGALEMTISGGGALSPDDDRFFLHLGIPILEGYGMTETSPVIAVRETARPVPETVGSPLPDTRIRIADPETGAVLYPDERRPYGGFGLRGEIWVRGPQVMKGYHREPELTASTIRDGWLRTGDLGMMTFNGCLKIIGRIKATIVLSSGENVEPEPIETRLRQSRFIAQCMAVGQDRKFVGVLIVPAPDAFREVGWRNTAYDALARDPEAIELIRAEIRRLTASERGFKRFEHVGAFRLTPGAFEIGVEMTNLHKVKRHVVEEVYARLIDGMYAAATEKLHGF